ncbi:DUF4148 domain-containing protein [Bordetella avium]|nr:DUF4148 domain-containing protein [Bordetella avium]AZY48875.1 DUF4148 domain-containing protein [Bordetella avium]AZY52253.1 DUF4148 domain-containing protein [Bordetella avium]RIQ14135.1 DUF4148 domain-containing protein [Bordetella avium]RIQ18009.1 DUF4148 domain-containing protein [Bordetella avium]RIQ36482.1 DUF4148 domain-containing protein [Bordetella avium]
MTALSASAIAADNVEPNNLPFRDVQITSEAPTSRTQIEEQLRQAKADGEYTFGELDYPPSNN